MGASALGSLEAQGLPGTGTFLSDMSEPGVTMKAILLLAGVLIALLGQAAPALPRANGYINDFAYVLPDESRQSLNARLLALKQETGIELAVVTLASRDDGSIEEYATRLFQAWGIGETGKDNGILVLVVPSAREMRIEVGYGIEAIVPDGLAGEIIRDDFTPSFRNGDYAGGIDNGVDRLIEVLRKGEALGKDWQPSASSPGDDVPLFFVLPCFGWCGGLGFSGRGGGVHGRDSFFLMWGAGFGGIPLLMSFAFLGFATPPAPLRMLILPSFAALMFAFGLIAHRTRVYRWLTTMPPSRSGSGSAASSRSWTSDGDSFGSSGSGGFSSGSSFGGGCSGGGGASGTW